MKGGYMTNSDFKEKIYGPYLDAWKVLKILQELDNLGQLKEVTDRYLKKCQEFDDTYKNNEFAQMLRKNMLLRADDVIVKMQGLE